jgi:cobalt-zinc-cadmium efflux system outer membrane protein
MLLDRKKTPIFILGAFTLMTGCAKVPKENGAMVSHLVEQRIGHKVKWNQDRNEDRKVSLKLQELLQQELSVDSSVQIALLNNRSLQAIFEELGIAQADLVQAGLLRNPIFDAAARFPKGSSKVGTEFSVTFGFLDLFSVPLRKKTAAIQFEQAKLKVADAILEHAKLVQISYYQLQTEINKRKIQQLLADAMGVALRLANRQQTAGNIGELEYASLIVKLDQFQLDVLKTDTEIVLLREQLNNLMGLSGQDTNWKILEDQLNVPQVEPQLDNLEELARENRLDLQIAKREVERIAKLAGLKQWWTYTDAQLGFTAQKEFDGQRLKGPNLEIEIPIFDHGQAERARLAAELRQSQQQFAALQIEIFSQVREHKDKLLLLGKMVDHYQKDILPNRKQLVTAAQNQYNIMALGVYTLLDNKKEELSAQIDYIDTLCAYWVNRVQLERVIGGKLPVQSVKTEHQEPVTSSTTSDNSAHNMSNHQH